MRSRDTSVHYVTLPHVPRHFLDRNYCRVFRVPCCLQLTPDSVTRSVVRLDAMYTSALKYVRAFAHFSLRRCDLIAP